MSVFSESFIKVLWNNISAFLPQIKLDKMYKKKKRSVYTLST